MHKVWETDMTFDLDLSPTDLNMNRGHLIIKDYLPSSKFEASWAKHSWIISCTKYGQSTWPLTLTFDLLTWKSVGIIYLSWNIYLPILKLLGKSIVELSDAQDMGDQHDLWPWPLTWISIGWFISCTRLRETDIPTDGHVQSNTVDGFIFVGTNFRGLKRNDTFVGFKICGHSIFVSPAKHSGT